MDTTYNAVFDFDPARDRLIFDVFWDGVGPRELDLTITLEPLIFGGTPSTRVTISYVEGFDADASQSNLGHVVILKGAPPDTVTSRNIAVNTTRGAEWKAARAGRLKQ